MPFYEIINYISHQNYQKRKFDGTHNLKKEILMAVNVIQKPFWNKFSFFGNFDGTHIPKKEIFDGSQYDLKIILEQIFLFGNLMAYVSRSLHPRE